MNYVIAASRALYSNSCERLSHRTGDRFVQVSDPAELTMPRLREIEPCRIFFPHWSFRIPKEIHSRYECVIFHMSDVPFGRGGSPLQNLIVRGFNDTVMTAMQCVEELDSGPVMLKRPLGLHGSAREIYARARDLIEDMIVEIIRDDPQPQPQRGDPVWFERRRPEDGDLAPLQSLDKIYDYVRMLDADGYPHAYLEVGNLRIEFTRAELQGDGITCSANIRLRKR